MKTLTHIFFGISTIVFTFLANSCTEELNNPDLGSTYPRLVVEGSITTDTMAHEVRLSTSGAVLNGVYPVISNAQVSITDGTNVFNLHEDISHKGIYRTDPDVFGVPGKTYTLGIKNVDVNNDGTMEEYSASSMLRNEDPLDSFHIVYDNSNVHMEGWTINLYARDIGGGRNFYLIKVYKNKVLLTDSIFKYSTSDNTGFEGKYFSGIPAYFLEEERKDERIKATDTITVEMDGITEGYFNFINDYIQEYYPKIPIFSGPSANISTNLSPQNMAIGFFAAYSISRKTRIYK